MPRIVSYNVRHCRGRDGKISPARIADVIASCRPDIVALQELDVSRSRSGLIDQAETIAELLKMKSHFHPAMHVMEEKYGDAILTALPSRLVKAGPLPGLPRHEPRGAVWAEVTIGTTSVQIINTHLSLFARERRLQVSALTGPEWLGGPDCRDPIVLVGDLNAPPWGRSYRALARTLRHGDRDDKRLATPATFPSRFPLLRIDHVLASRSIAIQSLQTLTTPLARIASDHLPLVADFRLSGTGLQPVSEELAAEP